MLTLSLALVRCHFSQTRVGVQSGRTREAFSCLGLMGVHHPGETWAEMLSEVLQPDKDHIEIESCLMLVTEGTVLEHLKMGLPGRREICISLAC